MKNPNGKAFILCRVFCVCPLIGGGRVMGFFFLIHKRRGTVDWLPGPPFVGSIHHPKARNINQIRYEGSKKKLIIGIFFNTHKIGKKKK